MATVFNNMAGGRAWGTLFFLFMVFAAISTELTVLEGIIASIRDVTGWSRTKGSIICCCGIFALSLTTALGYSLLKFQPFGEGTAWLDLWDFIVSTNLLPIGALLFSLFVTNNRFGWGWDTFLNEVNAGRGFKVRNWMRPIYAYLVPALVLIIYVFGLINFNW